MASCRYHVGASSSGAAAEPNTAITSTPRTPRVGQPMGLYLPGGGLTDTGGEGGCHPANVLISHPQQQQQQPEAASVFPPSYLGSGLIASSTGGESYSRDMTQLMTLPHPSHPNHHHQQHHHHHPHHHHDHQQQHQHHQPNTNANITTSAPTPRDTSSSVVVVVAAPASAARNPAAAAAAAAGTENRKSRRASCKSTYKHVPHREKAPHLVARRNARERRRVQAVNTAFVRLRRHVPHENRHKRLSKVKTLHFAIDYINYMQRLIHEYDAAVQRAGGGGRAAAGGGIGGGGGVGAAGGVAGLGAEHPACRLQPAVDMVELNSTKENRWMPVNLPPPHGGDQTRGLFLTPDGYGQYHQG